MSLVRGVCSLLLLSSAPGLLAQQAWIPLHTVGQTGVGVAESPLPPWLCTVYPGVLAAASFGQTFVGGVFRRRADALPNQIGGAQAAVFDAAHQRIVVYATDGASSSVCTFDGARWAVLPPSANDPSARIGPALGYDLSAGKVLLFGGAAPGSFGLPKNDTWQLDGATWTPLAPAGPVPTPRKNARLAPAVVPGGIELLLFGGNGQFGPGPFQSQDTWTWNGSAWTQRLPATQPPAREAAALAFDPGSGQTVLYGGRGTGTQPALGDAWAWTGTDWSPLPSPVPSPLDMPQLLRDGGRLVLVGANVLDGLQVHAWQAGWTQIYQEPKLPRVFGEAVAFDVVRDEIVRFGGRELYGTQFRNDTWRFGSAWQQATPATSPPARYYAAAAFDALRGETVLFGGQAGSTLLGDTWRWDGVDWQQATPASAPSPRSQAAACWDPARGTVVLFGGADGSGYLNDTWQWNGANWAPIASATAPSAQRGSMAFDMTRSVLALYLGFGAGLPGELWELQATGWSRVSTTAPSAGTLAFDPATGALVVFAGSGPSADYVAGAWVPRNQAYQAPLVTDPVRGGVLAVGAGVHQSTPFAATTSTYGAGCGPAGEVTCSLDRAAAFDAPVTAFVRTQAANTPTFLFFGATQVNVPLGGGCTVHLDNLLLSLGVFAAPTGWAAIDFVIPVVPGTIGQDVFAQALTLEPVGFGFSNGVALRLGL